MAKNRAKPKPKLPSDVRKALNSVLCYLYDDELEDAREFFKDNETLDGHVFGDIIAVQNWMNGTNTRAVDELNLEEDQ
jgi:hypothetical protein